MFINSCSLFSLISEKKRILFIFINNIVTILCILRRKSNESLKFYHKNVCLYGSVNTFSSNRLYRFNYNIFFIVILVVSSMYKYKEYIFLYKICTFFFILASYKFKLIAAHKIKNSIKIEEHKNA